MTARPWAPVEDDPELLGAAVAGWELRAWPMFADGVVRYWMWNIRQEGHPWPASHGPGEHALQAQARALRALMLLGVDTSELELTREELAALGLEFQRAARRRARFDSRTV